MKIKRYIGNTEQEAIYKLKRELGPNAVILHTRKIKKPGFFGFIKRPLVEVVAAREETEKNEKFNVNNLINKTMSNQISNSESVDNFNNEIKKLRSSIETLLNSLNKSTDNFIDNEYKDYLTILKQNGINEEVASSIINDINNRLNINNKDKALIKELIELEIKNYLGEVKPIKLDSNQKVIFFIGPTGVGKTTTLAKLAANFVINEKKNVGLITTDTYRIAAVEQLKIYSEILKLPLNIAYDVKEMYNSLLSFKDKDVILIDTAGRNVKDKDLKNELMDFIDTVNNKEIFLVISSTTNFETVLSTIKEYSFIENFKIIFSKTDESENLGIILNTKFYIKNPLSYITTGQSVPEDIEVVNIDKIAKNLVKEF